MASGTDLLILAQSPPEQPTSSGAPLSYYVITSTVAALALIVSLFNLWWTQRKNDERELTKWRRDTFTRALTPVLEEIERIRQNIGKPTVSNDEMVNDLLKLRYVETTFLMLKYPDFAKEYGMAVSTMVGEMHFRLWEPKLHFWLSSTLIPTMTYKIVDAAYHELYCKKPGRIRIMYDKFKTKLSNLKFRRPRNNPTEGETGAEQS